MEHLDRGLVVMPLVSGQYLVSWRLFGTDTPYTTFELLRNGISLKKDIYQTTSLKASGRASDTFQIVTVQSGVPTDTTAAVSPWSNYYLSLHLDRPEKQNNKAYFPNDCSVGDVDGDGQYEIFVKWDPENSKDNSNTGSSNPVIFDCYKLDGTKLWRIDLGINIRAGAHYTQFMVYDFDGDGRAEMICKTAPGSKDGNGEYVSYAADDATILGTSNTVDLRNGQGRILSGAEYLTVFEGQTGKAIHTTWYNPNRAGLFNQVSAHPEKSFWNDDYGNRADRHLACVAYLDGPGNNPSAVMCRGYYTRAYLWAVDFDGSKLKHKWLHASVNRNTVEHYDADWNKTTKTYSENTSRVGSNYTMFGNGNHNLSCGDVDGDGCDEIIWGSGAVDNDGNLLYSVGFGHGDAIHLGDFDPDRPGYELFDVHEEAISSYGCDMHDARTGEVLIRRTRERDTGRGIAADFDPNYRGAEFTYATQTSSYSISGQAISDRNPGMNFRIFWDGDIYEELFDDVTINKWENGETKALGLGFNRNALNSFGNPASCNGTKSTPNLIADIFGDWREEIILWSKTDSATINIYTSAYVTEHRVPTLMHDHLYRMGVAWQNVAYNQPPHLGYYLPDYVDSFCGISTTGIKGVYDNEPTTDRIVSRTYYTTDGSQIEASSVRQGIYIVRTQYADGRCETRKITLR
jgi:rhamnogalacturonan endolyase